MCLFLMRRWGWRSLFDLSAWYEMDERTRNRVDQVNLVKWISLTTILPHCYNAAAATAMALVTSIPNPLPN